MVYIYYKWFTFDYKTLKTLFLILTFEFLAVDCLIHIESFDNFLFSLRCHLIEQFFTNQIPNLLLYFFSFTIQLTFKTIIKHCYEWCQQNENNFKNKITINSRWRTHYNMIISIWNVCVKLYFNFEMTWNHGIICCKTLIIKLAFD